MEDVQQPVLSKPLEGFLGESRVAGVRFSWLPAAEVPEPYRGLLVHHGDMTSTLERFHGEEIGLEVLRQSAHDHRRYFREVILRARDSDRPVEYGAIEVLLPNFSPSMQAAILEGRQPLGGLLNETATDYGSSPLGYFSVASDALGTVFPETSGGGTLYGRYNQLLGEEGACLAHIVEILPGHPSS